MNRILTFILGFAMLVSCSKDNDTGNGSLKDVDSLASYETQIKSGVSIVFFHATWCSKCASQRPAVETLADNDTFQSVYFGQVDYEKVNDVVTKYGVVGFPTIIIYKNNEEKHRLEGQGHSEQKINDLLKALL